MPGSDEAVGSREPTEEEHVLTEVCKAREIAWVTHVTNVNVHGSSGLVSSLIRDQ